MTARHDSQRISYDDQADVFEERTGLSSEIARKVAEAVCEYAGLAAGDLIVEVGAGTGEIGQWLALPPYNYIGFDSSQPMLDVFMPRLQARPVAQTTVTVLCADAEGRWPVADGSAAAIFGSRVLHLLRAEHVIGEAQRVARPDGALVICGRVERSPDSPRSKARQKLRELLASYGLQPRPTRRRPMQLFSYAQSMGSTVLAPRVAASWPETVEVTRILDGWRGKTSLGGINPPAEVAEEVLNALTTWAAETYGDPAAPVTTETQYVLDGLRLSAGSVSAGAGHPRSPGSPQDKE